MENEDRIYVEENEEYEIVGTVIKDGITYKVAHFEEDDEEIQIEIPVRILGIEKLKDTEILYYIEDDDIMEEIFDLFEESYSYP